MTSARVEGDLGLVAQLAFWVALLVGFAIGGAVGAWKGFSVGGAVTGLTIGLLGGGSAAWVLHAYWQFWQAPDIAEATVVAETTPEGASRPVLTVRFTTRDGRVVETADTGPLPETAAGRPGLGQTVGVRYGPDATKVTLHPVRGWLIGATVFGMFSTFAFLTGLFFLGQIADERAAVRTAARAAEAEAEPLPPAGPRAATARAVTVLANLAFVGAVLWMFFGRGSASESFSASARVIAAAGLGYALAGLLAPGGPWAAVTIPLVVGIIFGLFGVLIRIVT